MRWMVAALSLLGLWAPTARAADEAERKLLR
jgi:hypothetical protein